MKHFRTWAEKRDTNPITPQALEPLKDWRRQDELYVKIHNPRAATRAHDVAAALEEWDTNQSSYCHCDGVPLREDELRNFVMKLVPAKIWGQLIYKTREPETWKQLKN